MQIAPETDVEAASRTVPIGPYQARLRYAKRSHAERFGIIVGSGFGGRQAFANQFQCPSLTIEVRTLSQWKVDEDDIASEMLAKLPALAETKKVVVAGMSGGAFAAFRIAAALARHGAPRPVRMVAFSPLTQIWPPQSFRMNVGMYKAMLTAAERDPQVKAALEQRGDLVPLLSGLPKAAPKADFRALVLVSRHHKGDYAQAQRLEGLPGVTLMPLDARYHLLDRFMLMPMGSEEEARRDISTRWGRFGNPESDAKPLTAKEIDQLYRVAKGLREKYPSFLDLVAALDTGKIVQPMQAASNAA